MSSEPEAGTYKDADTFKDSKGQPSQPVLINSGRSGSAWKVITIILTIFSVVLVIGLVTVSVQLANELNKNDGDSITTVLLNDLQDVPGGGRCDISSPSESMTIFCANGTFVPDLSNGGKSCECFQGYMGRNCDVLNDMVVVIARSDTYSSNLVTEEYWKNDMDDNEGMVSTQASYRIGYNGDTGFMNSIEPSIQDQLRQLHKKVGNAVTEGYQIIFGHSVQELMTAAVIAMSYNELPKNTTVTGSKVYYPNIWRDNVDYFAVRHFQWKAEALASRALTRGENVIQFSMSPSYANYAAPPEGTYRQVVDRSKYWPQYDTMSEDMNAKDDVTIFSLCSAAGHCGTRFAWAIVKSPIVYMSMRRYIGRFTMQMNSQDAYLRASTILDVILNRVKTDRCMFRYSKMQMKSRWDLFESVIEGSSFTIVTDRSDKGTPAYALLECDSAGKAFVASPEQVTKMAASLGTDSFPTSGCSAYLLFQANILGHDESDIAIPNGSAGSQVILDLTIRDSDFQLLLSKLNFFLVSQK